MSSDSNNQNSTANDGSLKVLEAYTRDFGRNVARLDRAYITSIHANLGDVLEIEGKIRRIVAKCLPLYPFDEGKSIIRIDSVTRNNVGVDIGDTVTVRRVVKVVPAESLVLVPVGARTRIPPLDRQYFADALESIPVTIGDSVLVSYYGGRLGFRVLGILPAHKQQEGNDDYNQNSKIPPIAVAPVLITQRTRVIIVNDAGNKPIKLNIKEYVRQEAQINSKFFATGVIEDNNNMIDDNNDATKSSENLPLILGFRVELTCLNTSDRIDYQVKLSTQQQLANDITRLAQHFIELAYSEVNAANARLIVELMEGSNNNLATLLIDQVNNVNTSANAADGSSGYLSNEYKDNRIQKMLRELKYSIIRKWIEEIKPG